MFSTWGCNQSLCYSVTIHPSCTAKFMTRASDHLEYMCNGIFSHRPSVSLRMITLACGFTGWSATLDADRSVDKTNVHVDPVLKGQFIPPKTPTNLIWSTALFIYLTRLGGIGCRDLCRNHAHALWRASWVTVLFLLNYNHKPYHCEEISAFFCEETLLQHFLCIRKVPSGSSVDKRRLDARSRCINGNAAQRKMCRVDVQFGVNGALFWLFMIF